MDPTAASATSVDRTPVPSEFGPGRLFLADSRLALMLLNQARYWTLNRVFGVSREQANLLTAVLALAAADAAYAGARRVFQAPLALSGGDAIIGGLALGEAGVRRLAGPQNGEIPHLGPLVAIGVLGGLAVPGLRQAARNLRAAEQRVRLRRISRYRAAASRPVGA